MIGKAHSENTDKTLLEKARHYCAYAEQCESGVRQKLIAWGASSQSIAHIVETLRTEGYLDDLRYARAYCESKVLHQHWGRLKVAYQLRSKQLPREVVDSALATIDDEAYTQMLHDVAARKRTELGAQPDAPRRIAAFLASRGFTTNEIAQVINLQ